MGRTEGTTDWNRRGPYATRYRQLSVPHVVSTERKAFARKRVLQTVTRVIYRPKQYRSYRFFGIFSKRHGPEQSRRE